MVCKSGDWPGLPFLPQQAFILTGSHTKVRKTKETIRKLKKLLVVKQILLISTLGNVQRTVWKIYAHFILLTTL